VQCYTRVYRRYLLRISDGTWRVSSVPSGRWRCSVTHVCTGGTCFASRTGLGEFPQSLQADGGAVLHTCVPEELVSHLGRDLASFLSPFRQMAVQCYTRVYRRKLASHLGRDLASFLSPFRQMAVECPQLTSAIHSFHHRWWFRCLNFPQKCGRWYSACQWQAGNEGSVVKRVVSSLSIRSERQCDVIVVM